MRAFHSQKLSYILGKNPFVLKENPSKISKNTFALKNLVCFFEWVKCPSVRSMKFCNVRILRCIFQASASKTLVSGGEVKVKEVRSRQQITKRDIAGVSIVLGLLLNLKHKPIKSEFWTVVERSD